MLGKRGKTMTEKQKCSSCGDDLDGEEIEAPRHDKDGTILCDKCFEDKYTHLCPICEDFYDEDLNAKITPKYLMVLKSVGENVGLTAGIYEIISYPFFADGIIEMHIFKGAVKRICDNPPDIKNCYTLYYVCNECVAKQLTKDKEEKA